MFDLKDFRQNVLKMTQDDFAKMIGVRQDYVSRMEKTPEAIEFSMLLKIAQATGTSLDELVGYKKSIPNALEVSNTWETSTFIKKTLLDYIKMKTEDIKLLSEEKYEKMVNDLHQMIESTIVKPSVAIVGMSDAGKSRLINSLLGMDKMPTSWTPTTSISVHIKHIDDRPDFIEDEVWIFKGDKNGFDFKKLTNENYCRKWKIAGGTTSLLAEYGTRQGDKYDIEDASAAVIFLESSILQICDIVDLPGFGTGDRKNDDILAQKSREIADVVIYMSIANGFLRGTDIEFLKTTLNSLPVIENKENKLSPLNNLFIVASQAHTVDNGNKTELERILDAGATRLYSEVPEEIWQNREEQSVYKHTINDLRNRFYTYTTDKPYLREDFEQEVKQLLEKLPTIINKNAKDSLQKYVEDQKILLKNDIKQYEEIISEREKYKQLLADIRKNEPIRIQENQKARMEVLGKVEKLHKDSIKQFEDEFASIISVDNIVEIIKEKKYKKKKQDMESLAGYLSSKIQAKMQGVLKKNSEELNEVIDKYLKNFNIQINKFESQLKGFQVPFDTVKVFASGLAGLATFGGLAIWASTLGNLGAYILVAKGVSVLSALGITVAGGTAGAASVVAALGGPITLGIALAVIVSLSVFAFATGGWQKGIAKKIVKEYSAQDAFGQFVKEIDKFWDDTEIAFNAAADHLDDEWKKYVDDLNNMVSSYSIKDIEQRIINANNLKAFFVEMPLSEPAMA
jgi:transcriptional regulator with XRE-family HTH domain